ncbi:MAG: hypothetical protein U0835_23510 [Isosphaeraceae bacterium]
MLDGLKVVIRRELLVGTRRVRSYEYRSFAVVALLIGVAAGILYLYKQIGPGWVVASWQLRDAAQVAFFGMLVGAEFLVIGLVPAAVVTGIAGERERATLDALLTTQLSSFEILSGKLISVLFALTSLLAAGLPLAVLITQLSGLDLRVILLFVAAATSTTLVILTWSALAAVWSKDVRTGVRRSILGVVAWLELPFLLSVLGPRWLPGVYPWLAPVNRWFLATGPMSGMAHLAGLLPARSVFEVVSWMILYQSIAAAVILCAAVARLRPAHARLAGSSATVWGVFQRGWSSRPPCGDDPVRWKERYIPSLPLPLQTAVWVLYLGLFGVLFLVMGVMGLPAWRELLAKGYWNYEGGDERWLFAQFFVRPIVGLLAFIFSLVAGAMVAESLQAERRKNTWIVLLSTPLSGREILAEKQAEILRKWRPIFLAVGLVWASGLVLGALHPVGLVFSLLGLTALVRITSAVAMHSGVKSIERENGLAGGLLILVAVSLGFWLLTVVSHRAELAVSAIFSPIMLMMISALTADEVRSLLAPGKFAGIPTLGLFAQYGGGRWAALAVAIGPVVQLWLARRVELAAFAAWDEAVGRPVRPARTVGNAQLTGPTVLPAVAETA